MQAPPFQALLNTIFILNVNGGHHRPTSVCQPYITPAADFPKHCICNKQWRTHKNFETLYHFADSCNIDEFIVAQRSGSTTYFQSYFNRHRWCLSSVQLFIFRANDFSSVQITIAMRQWHECPPWPSSEISKSNDHGSSFSELLHKNSGTIYYKILTNFRLYRFGHLGDLFLNKIILIDTSMCRSSHFFISFISYPLLQLWFTLLALLCSIFKFFPHLVHLSFVLNHAHSSEFRLFHNTRKLTNYLT